MIHSIDPLYEEPVSYAMQNGRDEIHKDHIHPPGAAYCPICGEEGHRVKLTTQGDAFFKTTKQMMSNGNSIDKSDAKLATGNGALERQETVSERRDLKGSRRKTPILTSPKTSFFLGLRLF